MITQANYHLLSIPETLSVLQWRIYKPRWFWTLCMWQDRTSGRKYLLNLTNTAAFTHSISFLGNYFATCCTDTLTSGEVLQLLCLLALLNTKYMAVLVMMAFNLWEAINHQPLRDINIELRVWNMAKSGDIAAFNMHQCDKRNWVVVTDSALWNNF